MRIFIGSNPGYWRLVHADILCHILQDKRLQVANTIIKKISLKFYNALSYLIDSPLSLLNALYQPFGCAKLFLNIYLCCICSPPVFLNQFSIVRAYPQPRKTV